MITQLFRKNRAGHYQQGNSYFLLNTGARSEWSTSREGEGIESAYGGENQPVGNGHEGAPPVDATKHTEHCRPGQPYECALEGEAPAGEPWK